MASSKQNCARTASMASSSSSLLFVLFILALASWMCEAHSTSTTHKVTSSSSTSSTTHNVTSSSSSCLRMETLISFGDSLTDVGNLIRDSPHDMPSRHPPYGNTFFHHPTGRFSDGRLVVDFIAQALGMPLSQPFLNRKADFRHGVNFAYAGATALDPTALLFKYNATSFTRGSLHEEVSWFLRFKKHRCGLFRLHKSACKEYFKKALYFFGEIGGNDYFAMLASQRNVTKVIALVPPVIGQIHKSLEILIRNGATTIIVQGGYPQGCLQSVLSSMKEPAQDYDQMGCLKVINEINKLHNEKLQDVIHHLQHKHPNVLIVYLDAYSAFYDIIENAEIYGFKKITEPCLQISFNPANKSMKHDTPSCTNPSEYVNFDSVHLTERMYRALTTKFLIGGYAKPSPNFLNRVCILPSHN